jgi:hypothetical protein
LGHPVVLTATYSPLLLQRVPLVMGSRSAGIGLLLAPRSLSDGDLFGVRFEVDANAPPGRGILITHGLARSIQVGWAGPGAGLRQRPDTRPRHDAPEQRSPATTAANEARAQGNEEHWLARNVVNGPHGQSAGVVLPVRDA